MFRAFVESGNEEGEVAQPATSNTTMWVAIAVAAAVVVALLALVLL
jgi:hypothetical protein